MKKIYDKAVIEDSLKKARLAEQFDTEELDFLVIRYQRGEFLSTPDQAITYFQFLIKGSVALYYLDEDGSRRNVAVADTTVVLLGDMEFVMGNTPIFYTEALTPVTVAALPIEENRARLEKDCRFLMYLLRQAFQIKIISARSTVELPRLEERLLYHMEHDCPHQTITGMETTSAKLRCSRRQLQRVVKKLEEKGRLVKLRKGCYQLV